MRTFMGVSGFSLFNMRLLLILFISMTANAGATDFITGEYQLSGKEKRVGEAYYRADMQWMAYQAEVADDNPFYQIFLKNIASGKIQQVSPGTGKTTCSWVHPSQEKVLFSSTHEDPDAKTKMTAEIERRKSGERQSYAWTYFQ